MTTEIRSCEEALRTLVAHLDLELDAAATHELEQHLEKCRSCYSRAEFERKLKAKVAAAGREPVRPPLAARIRGMIDEFDVAGAD